MGNGNNMHFVEVEIEVCTGDHNRIKFDRPAFRDSRSEANRALAELSVIGMGGNDMSWYQNDTQVHGWLSKFPVLSHITHIAVVKVNRESSAERLVSVREYECEHTKEAS